MAYSDTVRQWGACEVTREALQSREGEHEEKEEEYGDFRHEKGSKLPLIVILDVVSLCVAKHARKSHLELCKISRSASLLKRVVLRVVLWQLGVDGDRGALSVATATLKQ